MIHRALLRIRAAEDAALAKKESEQPMAVEAPKPDASAAVGEEENRLAGRQKRGRRQA